MRKEVKMRTSASDRTHFSYQIFGGEINHLKYEIRKQHTIICHKDINVSSVRQLFWEMMYCYRVLTELSSRRCPLERSAHFARKPIP